MGRRDERIPHGLATHAMQHVGGCTGHRVTDLAHARGAASARRHHAFNVEIRLVCLQTTTHTALVLALARDHHHHRRRELIREHCTIERLHIVKPAAAHQINDDTTTICWFRRDLRLHDNPALSAAASKGAVVALYIDATEDECQWPAGAASRVWLHHSLRSLANDLAHAGTPLLIRRGPSKTVLHDVALEARASQVVWNRCYEPEAIHRDRAMKQFLRSKKIDVQSFNGSLLHEPFSILNQQQQPFRVFSAYYRRCQKLPPPPPALPAPVTLRAPSTSLAGLTLDELGMTPALKWSQRLIKAWPIGRAGAIAQLELFTDGDVTHYATQRDRPDRTGVSRLSPHLHFGELSVREVWHALRQTQQRNYAGCEAFLRQLYWREFAYAVLYHFPHTTDRCLHDKFHRFPWRDADCASYDLKAWQRGDTGYPLIDAGMRELWHTGWMHNRVRMNVASFLVKHLLIDWRLGARWFWDTLVDADLANNTMGWQWAAGCGVDAAPYFRIFNPVLQGQRFDPNGDYIRRWIPELKALPSSLIHCPWRASQRQLDDANVVLGETYPRPIVDHRTARERALSALQSIR